MSSHPTGYDEVAATFGGFYGGMTADEAQAIREVHNPTVGDLTRRSVEQGIDTALALPSGGLLDYDTARMAVNRSPVNEAAGISAPDLSVSDPAGPVTPFPSVEDVATADDFTERVRGDAFRSSARDLAESADDIMNVSLEPPDLSPSVPLWAKVLAVVGVLALLAGQFGKLFDIGVGA